MKKASVPSTPIKPPPSGGSTFLQSHHVNPPGRNARAHPSASGNGAAPTSSPPPPDSCSHTHTISASTGASTSTSTAQADRPVATVSPSARCLTLEAQAQLCSPTEAWEENGLPTWSTNRSLVSASKYGCSAAHELSGSAPARAMTSTAAKHNHGRVNDGSGVAGLTVTPETQQPARSPGEQTSAPQETGLSACCGGGDGGNGKDVWAEQTGGEPHESGPELPSQRREQHGGTTAQNHQTQAQEAANYETQHVHSVYASIAAHFSSTRHKPWPRVASYLAGMKKGCVGLDVGCGNGKYIGVNKDVWMIGSDACQELLVCASERLKEARKEEKAKGLEGRDAGNKAGKSKGKKQQQNTQAGGANEQLTDSTATTTAELEKLASQQHDGGEASIQADTLYLPFPGSRFDFAICIAVLHHLSTRERRIEGVASVLSCLKPGGTALLYVWALEQEGSRRGWSKDGDQDLLVPWVRKGNKKLKEAGMEAGEEDETFRRYYHLYRQGELEEDAEMAGGMVVESGYEKDNWWVVCERRDGIPKRSGER